MCILHFLCQYYKAHTQFLDPIVVTSQPTINKKNLMLN
jgi:hypothetical protein